MNQQTLMLALFMVLGVVLVTGLIAVPVIEEADATSCKTKDGITTCSLRSQKTGANKKEMNNKYMKNQEIMLALFITLGIVLVAGLVVVPVLEEADARCEGFKKNGDLCKPKKNRG